MSEKEEFAYFRRDIDATRKIIYGIIRDNSAELRQDVQPGLQGRRRAATSPGAPAGV